MDEDIRIIERFPSPPSDDFDDFIDSLMTTPLFTSPLSRKTYVHRRRKPYVELSGPDLLRRMRQKTTVSSSKLLRKIVLDKRACQVAVIENNRLGLELSMDSWEDLFWDHRADKLWAQYLRDAWRDQFKLVIEDIRGL
jgi:hypothetical protein